MATRQNPAHKPYAKVYKIRYQKTGNRAHLYVSIKFFFVRFYLTNFSWGGFCRFWELNRKSLPWGAPKDARQCRIIQDESVCRWCNRREGKWPGRAGRRTEKCEQIEPARERRLKATSEKSSRCRSSVRVSNSIDRLSPLGSHNTPSIYPAATMTSSRTDSHSNPIPPTPMKTTYNIHTSYFNSGYFFFSMLPIFSLHYI